MSITKSAVLLALLASIFSARVCASPIMNCGIYSLNGPEVVGRDLQFNETHGPCLQISMTADSTIDFNGYSISNPYKSTQNERNSAAAITVTNQIYDLEIRNAVIVGATVPILLVNSSGVLVDNATINGTNTIDLTTGGIFATNVKSLTVQNSHFNGFSCETQCSAVYCENCASVTITNTSADQFYGSVAHILLTNVNNASVISNSITNNYAQNDSFGVIAISMKNVPHMQVMNNSVRSLSSFTGEGFPAVGIYALNSSGSISDNRIFDIEAKSDDSLESITIYEGNAAGILVSNSSSVAVVANFIFQIQGGDKCFSQPNLGITGEYGILVLGSNNCSIMINNINNVFGCPNQSAVGIVFAQESTFITVTQNVIIMVNPANSSSIMNPILWGNLSTGAVYDNSVSTSNPTYTNNFSGPCVNYNVNYGPLCFSNTLPLDCCDPDTCTMSSSGRFCSDNAVCSGLSAQCSAPASTSAPTQSSTLTSPTRQPPTSTSLSTSTPMPSSTPMLTPMLTPTSPTRQAPTPTSTLTPTSSSSSSSASAPTLTSTQQILTVPPQQWNNCSDLCFRNGGECYCGMCVCDSNMTGPDCSIPVTSSKMSMMILDNMPRVSILPILDGNETEVYPYYIDLVYIVEHDDNGVVVQSSQPQNSFLAEPLFWTKDEQFDSICVFTANLTNGATLIMTAGHSFTQQSMMFAGMNVALSHGSVKQTIEIKKWPFRSPNNYIVISSNCTTQNAVNISSDQFDNQGNLVWYQAQNGAQALYSQFISSAVLDGKTTPIKVGVNDNGNGFSMTVPWFESSAVVDPTFTAIIFPDMPDSSMDTPSKNIPPGFTLPLPIIIAVSVAGAIVFAIVLLGAIVVRRKIMSMKRLTKTLEKAADPGNIGAAQL